MKLNHISLALMLGIGVITSCESKLDVVNVNRQTANTFGQTADELEDVDMGVFRYLYKDQPAIMKGKGSKTSLALNVRCVKEISED